MEAESYWLKLVHDLVGITRPLRGGHEMATDEPAWVDKLTCEVFNMITPKMQLRAGAKPTADKIGAMIGSHLVQIAQVKHFANIPKPTEGGARLAFRMGYGLGTPPGFENGAALMRQNLPSVEGQIQKVVARVLSERPLHEAAEFFKGLSRGLAQNERSLIPEIQNGQPKYNPKQFELMRRLMVYVIARHNWRELDQLKTSQQAFEWFEKRLPAPILGNDPERIRKMFYRVGKRFKEPGRPKKGTTPS
jgi:hypothetical protein